MAQEIKIPVSANTAGATKAAEDLAGAFEDVADAVAGVGNASRSANRGLGDLLRRARETRQMLSRELRSDISGADAVTFMRNFAGMQPRSASLRGFRTEQDWFTGHQTLFRDPRRAAEHRRRVLAYGMQGTSFARKNPPPAPPRPDDGGGGGEGGGGGSGFQAGLQRSGNIAMGFGRSLLALAGINSVIAMAGRAADLATEEATGTDTLKRRMGDLGVEFNRLRDRTRAAGDGLGITFVESQRLAQAYQREVGNLGRTDLDGLGGNLRNAYGFARAYGVDPATSTQFFGQMARYGVGRDDAGARRLALLIGDAVAKTGYGGKVDELLQAVADYTAVSSRMSLTVANSDAYANAITSLSSRGIPGLDPQNAAALLSAADSAIRRGGAMGEASLNFSYAALRNANPGINPVQGMALMEGGLFATTRQVFGPGANGAPNPLARYMGQGIRLDDTTNIDKMIPLLRRQYGNGGYFLDALKNHFGLASHAQAAALADMSDRGLLGATSNVLGAAGVDPMRLSASGMQMIGALANAHGAGLEQAFKSIVDRRDITPEQRKALLAAAAGARGGGEEALRRAMVGAVANLGISQEKTLGTETRDAITDLTNKLTQAGGPLLSVLNPIRDAVVRLAEQFIPGYIDSSGTRPVGSSPWAAGNQGVGRANKDRAPLEQQAMAYFMSTGRSKLAAAGIVGGLIAESNLDPLAMGDGNKARGIGQWHSDRWKRLVAFAAQRGLDPNDFKTQLQFVDWEMRNNESLAGSMLVNPRSVEAAAAGMVEYERPRGYNGLIPGSWRGVSGWDSRFEQAQRLAAENLTPASSPPAAPQPQHHIVEIVGTDAQGRTIHKRIELPTSVGAPAPAGSRDRLHAGSAPR